MYNISDLVSQYNAIYKIIKLSTLLEGSSLDINNNNDNILLLCFSCWAHHGLEWNGGGRLKPGKVRMELLKKCPERLLKFGALLLLQKRTPGGRSCALPFPHTAAHRISDPFV